MQRPDGWASCMLELFIVSEELTALTARTLMRMYSSLPGEWQLISVCQSRAFRDKHPAKLKGCWKMNWNMKLPCRTGSGQQEDCLNTTLIMIYGRCPMSALHRDFFFLVPCWEHILVLLLLFIINSFLFSVACCIKVIMEVAHVFFISKNEHNTGL